MRHQVDHKKLGRTASHRKALLRNMATSLVLAERIETTLPKAKELRRLADNLITLGKDGSLHARRQAARVLRLQGTGDGGYEQVALKKLFGELATRFKERNGGYTRIYRFGKRSGDSASMAAIEYIGYEIKKPSEKTASKKASKGDKTKTASTAPEKKRGFWSSLRGRKDQDSTS